MGTAVGKPTFGGTSGMVAMIALALALVSFSVLLSDLTVCRDAGVASSTTRLLLKKELNSPDTVFGEIGGVSGSSPP